MNNPSERTERDEQVRLAEEVSYLTDEIKLLAINLAVVMARLKRDKHPTDLLEPQLSDFINQAVEAAERVRAVLEATRGQKAMVYQLPPSEEIIARRGVYDQIEQTLLQIYELSQDVIQSLTRLTGSSI
jgi:hypothetical protein